MAIKNSVLDILITKRFVVYIHKVKVFIPIRRIGDLHV